METYRLLVTKRTQLGHSGGLRIRSEYLGQDFKKSRNIGETPLGIKWSERISLSVLFTNTYYLRLIDTYCSLEEDLCTRERPDAWSDCCK